MMAVPGIYGDLSEAASAAYARWMLALFAKTQHVDECSCCNDLHVCCPDGVATAQAELAAWRAWNRVRPAEVTNRG